MAPSGPTRQSPGVSKGTRLARRPHRKSRNGCINCKRRKVKCDEVKPACANCVRFGITCDFALSLTDSLAVAQQRAYNPPSEIAQPGGGIRRGPGRPRKDWAALPLPKAKQVDFDPDAQRASPAASDATSCSLNVTDAELLFQFISYTSESLGAHDNVGSRVATFWTHNAPRIGLTYHFVLHLLYSLAAYHLAYQEADGDLQDRYISLAEHHAALGLGELNRELLNLNETNCGALYLSAVLVCYCSFAAGPTSNTDLLICDVGDGAPERWLPLIHGVRLIRQTIDPATLFTGLLSPLGPAGRPSNKDNIPVYIRDGFERIQWVEPLEKLKDLITSKQSPNTVIYLRAFEGLRDLYEATYGDVDGTYGGSTHNQFVFGWLYRTQDTFVACLRQKQPLALLVLAYYAPLFTTLKQCWFLDGWAEHLLKSIGAIIESDLVGWLQWPMTVTRLSTSDFP